MEAKSNSEYSVKNYLPWLSLDQRGKLMRESIRQHIKREKENPSPKFIPDGTPFQLSTTDCALGPHELYCARQRIAKEIVSYVQAVDCGSTVFQKGILPQYFKVICGLNNKDKNTLENNGLITLLWILKSSALIKLDFNKEEIKLLVKHGIVHLRRRHNRLKNCKCVSNYFW